MADQPPDDRHTHLVEFPEALEVFLTRAGELVATLGPGKAEGVRALEALVQEGLAARELGDVPRAVRAIVRAMDLLADLAGDQAQLDGPTLRAMAAQFRTALARGALGDAKASADVMRERSGATIVPRKRG
jgi:hypothetical protein